MSTEQPEAEGDYNILIAGLPKDMGDIDLRRLCSPFGDILRAVVMFKANTATSRGFGFVLFRRAEDGRRAEAALDGATLGDNILSAKRSTHSGNVEESSQIFVRNIPSTVTRAVIHQTIEEFLGVRVRRTEVTAGSSRHVVSATLDVGDVDTARQAIAKLHRVMFTDLIGGSSRGGLAPAARRSGDESASLTAPVPPMLAKFAESDSARAQRFMRSHRGAHASTGPGYVAPDPPVDAPATTASTAATAAASARVLAPPMSFYSSAVPQALPVLHLPQQQNRQQQQQQQQHHQQPHEAQFVQQQPQQHQLHHGLYMDPPPAAGSYAPQPFHMAPASFTFVPMGVPAQQHPHQFAFVHQLPGGALAPSAPSAAWHAPPLFHQHQYHLPYQFHPHQPPPQHQHHQLHQQLVGGVTPAVVMAAAGQLQPHMAVWPSPTPPLAAHPSEAGVIHQQFGAPPPLGPS